MTARARLAFLAGDAVTDALAYGPEPESRPDGPGMLPGSCPLLRRAYDAKPGTDRADAPEALESLSLRASVLGSTVASAGGGGRRGGPVRCPLCSALGRSGVPDGEFTRGGRRGGLAATSADWSTALAGFEGPSAGRGGALHVGERRKMN